MLKQIIGFVSLLLSGAWWLGIGREFIKAIIFDRILHMLNPDAWPIATIAFQYGPPILLAALGLGSPFSPPTAATPRGAKLITLGTIFCVGSVIMAVTGMALIFIGDRQNSPDAVMAFRESGKTPEVKVFVPPEITPERLLSFFQENTAIQATALTNDYIGQWLPVTNTVRNVGAFTGRSAQVTFEKNYVSPRTWFDDADIYCYFRKKPQIDRLKILKQGDKITVIGQIREIFPLTLSLDNCELVDSVSK